MVSKQNIVPLADFRQQKHPDWPRIWVCCESQIGKSAFINKYLGQTVCKEGNSRESCTKDFQIYEDPVSCTTIVDTQGLNDSKNRDSEFMSNVANMAKESGIKVALFVFIIKQ